MAIYKRGKVYWYKFVFNGVTVRASAKTGNERAAGQIEAARKTQLAKGEVGIKDRKPVCTLAEFAEGEFLPFVEKHNQGKPKTVEFYKQRVARIKTFPRLWDSKLDAIEAEDLTAFIGARQKVQAETSTINRDLATLRRMFKLAMEWKRVPVLLPKITLLSGENRRERVVSPDEETAYLAAAAPLLRDLAVLLFDCGLRPEEAHRLTWAQFRAGNIEIHTGKTKDARRSIPASPRVTEMLMRRRQIVNGEWVFPAPTATGHINEDSIKKQHAAALKAAELQRFVPYSIRHTCLTRWAEAGLDTFTLKRLAGHADIATTMRYVHMNDGRARQALEGIWKAAQGGHKNGHSGKNKKAARVASGS